MDRDLELLPRVADGIFPASYALLLSDPFGHGAFSPRWGSLWAGA